MSDDVAAQDHNHICGARMDKPPETWPMRRRPICNRVANHPEPGVHRETDRRTFALRAEWSSEECYVPRDKKAHA